MSKKFSFPARNPANRFGEWAKRPDFRERMVSTLNLQDPEWTAQTLRDMGLTYLHEFAKRSIGRLILDKEHDGVGVGAIVNAWYNEKIGRLQAEVAVATLSTSPELAPRIAPIKDKIKEGRITDLSMGGDVYMYPDGKQDFVMQEVSFVEKPFDKNTSVGVFEARLSENMSKQILPLSTSGNTSKSAMSAPTQPPATAPAAETPAPTANPEAKMETTPTAPVAVQWKMPVMPDINTIELPKLVPDAEFATYSKTGQDAVNLAAKLQREEQYREATKDIRPADEVADIVKGLGEFTTTQSAADTFTDILYNRQYSETTNAIKTMLSTVASLRAENSKLKADLDGSNKIHTEVTTALENAKEQSTYNKVPASTFTSIISTLKKTTAAPATTAPAKLVPDSMKTGGAQTAPVGGAPVPVGTAAMNESGGEKRKGDIDDDRLKRIRYFQNTFSYA